MSYLQNHWNIEIIENVVKARKYWGHAVLEYEYMRVNNLLKVITRRKSGDTGIWTCDL